MNISYATIRNNKPPFVHTLIIFILIYAHMRINKKQNHLNSYNTLWIILLKKK